MEVEKSFLFLSGVLLPFRYILVFPARRRDAPRLLVMTDVMMFVFVARKVFVRSAVNIMTVLSFIELC